MRGCDVGVIVLVRGHRGAHPNRASNPDYRTYCQRGACVPRCRAAISSGIGRPSIAPDKLLRGSLLQIIFSVHSERQPMEQLDYNLMFRWFVGLGIDDPVWDHSVYAKNRDRLLEANIARKFMKGIIAHPEVAPLLSERTLRGRWYARQCLGLAQELRAQGQRFRGQRVEAS
jgi:hypothetical protein